MSHHPRQPSLPVKNSLFPVRAMFAKFAKFAKFANFNTFNARHTAALL